MFKYAITRKPSESMIKGLTKARLGKPNYALACEQHAAYIEALQNCGLNVKVLDALDAFPDACFIGDIALYTPKGAILTHPKMPSRQGEVKNTLNIISRLYPNPDIIIAPGHLEAEDIMMVGGHFYIGLSTRTNRQGAEQMISLLTQQGFSGSIIKKSSLLHLKSGVSYLENNILLAFGELYNHPDFSDYNRIEVSQDERYAANSVWVNGTVLVPKGYAKTLAAIQSHGYPTQELAMSEFQKLDGGLSGLSLRF